jgi:hypothetical protein
LGFWVLSGLRDSLLWRRRCGVLAPFAGTLEITADGGPHVVEKALVVHRSTFRGVGSESWRTDRVVAVARLLLDLTLSDAPEDRAC